MRLAPLYDLGTHAPYPSAAPLKSAMKIGDEYRFDRINKGDLVSAARKLSLSPDWAEQRVDEIRQGVASAYADAASGIDAPFARTVAESVAAFVANRGW